MTRTHSFKKVIFRIAKNGWIAVLLSLLIILALVIWFGGVKGDQTDILFDLTIFIAFVAAALVQSVAGLIERLIANWAEDDVKLDTNYERIVMRYPKRYLPDGTEIDELFCCDNACAPERDLKKLSVIESNSCELVRMPILVDAYTKEGDDIIIEDSKERYKLPEYMVSHFTELFSAHSTSSINNQLNIRVNSWHHKPGCLSLKTSRTTYFDSLVTNRAMDYQLTDGLSLRERYQFGPFPPTLEQSSMSNHLGFNGFIISSDCKVPFVLRNASNSIAKRIYGTSVAASLKAMYALDHTRSFTPNGLLNAIYSEIEDELKISRDDLLCCPVAGQYIIAAYRDLVEGGKPQLLVVFHSSKSAQEINKSFVEQTRKARKSRKKWDIIARSKEDGGRLLWVSLKDLARAAVGNQAVVIGNKTLRMMPSSAVSVALLRDWLAEHSLQPPQYIPSTRAHNESHDTESMQ